MKADIDEKKQKITLLKQESANLRATIANLNDVKKVINRVTDKEQLTIDAGRLNNRSGVKTGNVQQKKPSSSIPFNAHDVDDNFWYADKHIKLPSVQTIRKKK